MKHITTLALLLFVVCAAPSILGAESPLQTVMDGREAAGESNLTESAIRGTDTEPGLAQKAANIVMYICGALAIILTALGLYQLYQVQDSENMYGGTSATKGGALWKLLIAGLISIPAIIAAIIPYAVL